MTTYVGATEAARLLGVTKPTLYAYVSRGIIGRRTATDGRSSLFALDELEAVAGRSRRRDVTTRPTLDVQIVSAVTTLDEDGLRFRGRDVADLAVTATFEQVAELLWTGQLPAVPPRWPAPSTTEVATCRAALAAVTPPLDPLGALVVVATVLGAAHPDDDPPTAARRLLATVPAALGAAASRGDLATRLTRAWARRPAPELVTAVHRALVLLADHELSTSTLAVRIAGSVRTDPYGAFVAGIGVMRGRLHGSAAAQVHELLLECERDGAAVVVARRREARDLLPGFGHAVYRGDDPRVAPLADAVRALPDPAGRMSVVDDLLAAAGRVVPRRPNVDAALGALSFVGGLPPDVPLFAIARIAGWAAHLAEELAEPPLRYRGLARRPTDLSA